MFKGLINELKKLERRQEVSIPILPDEDGFLDKECPSKECLFKFKVNAEDWKNIFKDEAVYCPLCRQEAPSNSWWTTEQIEEGKRQAVEKVKADLGQALANGAKAFNRQPQRGFLQFSVKVSGSLKRFVAVPIQSQKEMEQKIQCATCGSRFAVIGSAFFCPCCGYNSVERTFLGSIAKIEANIRNLSKVKTALGEINLQDEAENTSRFIIESSLSASVAALQKVSEELYKKQLNAKGIQQNGFQRIDYMTDAWSDIWGVSLPDWLSESELKAMKILYQRRHLLQHQDGIVDQKYIDKSEDDAYKIGQRIVVKETDVLQLVKIVTKIYDGIIRLSSNTKHG